MTDRRNRGRNRQAERERETETERESEGVSRAQGPREREGGIEHLESTSGIIKEFHGLRQDSSQQG